MLQNESKSIGIDTSADKFVYGEENARGIVALTAVRSRPRVIHGKQNLIMVSKLAWKYRRHSTNKEGRELIPK